MLMKMKLVALRNMKVDCTCSLAESDYGYGGKGIHSHRGED